MKEMNVTSPWIQTTNRCNLSCDYCFVKQSTKDMKIEVFKSITSRYTNLLRTRALDKVQLRISGGEPLLVFNNYKDELEDFINNNRDLIHVEFLTNLTVLPDCFLDFIEKYKDFVGLCISLDSLAFSKPFKNGKTSSNKVTKNIIKIQERLPHTNISISTVITDNGIHLDALAKYIAENNFALWDMSFNKLSNSFHFEKLCKNIDKFILQLYRCDYSILRVRFNEISFVPHESCGAGKELICIDTDSNEYPCQTLIGAKEFKEVELTSCLNCSIYRYCGGDCKYHNNELRRKKLCPILKYYFITASKHLN